MAYRDYILHNFWWKLLSLLLAALTWLMIETTFKNEEELQKTPVMPGASLRSFPAVPVTLLTSVANAGRFTVVPQTVKVDVTGTQEALEKLQQQDLKAYVDVTDAEDEMQFRKTIQLQTPKDLRAAAVPPVASVERISRDAQPK